jgi:hypothetical protein
MSADTETVNCPRAAVDRHKGGLHVDLLLSEECGRTGLLILRDAWAGGCLVPLTMRLYSANEICGVCMHGATGDTVPQVSALKTCMGPDELVAVAELEGPMRKAKSPRAGKATAEDDDRRACRVPACLPGGSALLPVTSQPRYSPASLRTAPRVSGSSRNRRESS